MFLEEQKVIKELTDTIISNPTPPSYSLFSWFHVRWCQVQWAAFMASVY